MISFSEPEPSTDQTDKIDSVTNQDGWLNSLSLENITNTVCEREIKNESTTFS
jgi:hypothetical protein